MRCARGSQREQKPNILELKHNLPALPEILISVAAGMSLMRGLFVPLASLRVESGQVRVSFHKENYLQTWKIWGLSDSKDLVLDFLRPPESFRCTRRLGRKTWESVS